MTTTSSHMASNFEPHNVMSANVGITVKQNGQSLRTNSSNSEAQPIVGSTVAADKEKKLSAKDLSQQQYINDSEKEKEEQNEELRERVDEKLKDMEEMPALRKIGIKFVKHKDPECNVVNVVDTESEEMIRQIPSEEFLKISQKLDEFCDDFTKVKQTNAEDDAKGRGKNHSVLFDTKI